MGEDTAEGVGANVAFPDVGVPVHVGAEWELTIVGVDHVDIGQPEQFLDGADGGAESRDGRDVEAGGQEMAGIQAVTLSGDR